MTSVGGMICYKGTSQRVCERGEDKARGDGLTSIRRMPLRNLRLALSVVAFG